MLKLNQEYTYKKICEELGWKESSGNQKKKQIKEIEDSYEFYHPENKKTHKPKKSYIFTKQLKKPELQDRRANNGAVKKIPDATFEYLFQCILVSGIRKNGYHQRGRMNDIYIPSYLIYKEFGFDIYKILKDMTSVFEEYICIKAKKIFQDLCIDTVRNQTITRICKMLGYPANNLPKGILRQESKSCEHTVPDDDLLIEYEIYMGWFLDFYELRSEREAVRSGKYFEIIEGIEHEFEVHMKKYGVRKLNKITVESIEFEQHFKSDRKQKEMLQEVFQRVILHTILDGIQRRCNSEKHYKVELSLDEKAILIRYFEKMYVVAKCEDKKILERTEELKNQIKQQIEERNRNEIETVSGIEGE